MSKLKDLTGQKFGRLTVIERAENKGKQTCWRCKCDCGNICIVIGHDLRRGHTQSCGCLNKEIIVNDLAEQKFGRLTVIERAGSKNGFATWRCKCDCGNECIAVGSGLTSGETRSCGICLGAHHKHGMRHTKIYHIWLSVKDRCTNSNCKQYKDYGGRGITIFPEWQTDFLAFYNYVSKLEHYGEEGYSLDRIDNNGNYEPDNLRWADRKAQCRNKRNNHFVEYNGKMIPLSEAAELTGINHATLWNRCRVGDTGDKLFRPVETKFSKKRS